MKQSDLVLPPRFDGAITPYEPADYYSQADERRRFTTSTLPSDINPARLQTRYRDGHTNDLMLAFANLVHFTIAREINPKISQYNEERDISTQSPAWALPTKSSSSFMIFIEEEKASTIIKSETTHRTHLYATRVICPEIYILHGVINSFQREEQYDAVESLTAFKEKSLSWIEIVKQARERAKQARLAQDHSKKFTTLANSSERPRLRLVEG